MGRAVPTLCGGGCSGELSRAEKCEPFCAAGLSLTKPPSIPHPFSLYGWPLYRAASNGKGSLMRMFSSTYGTIL